MPNRNNDGTFRGKRAKKATGRVLVARWLEAEVVRLKALGMNFAQIADQITAVGRGNAQSMTVVPEGLQFPPGYSVSAQGCHKAYRRAMEREPALALEEHRRLDTARCEEMFFALQPGLRSGDTKSIDTGVRVLTLKSKLLGLEAPRRVELAGREGGPLTVEMFRDLCETAEREASKEDDEK